ncbi:mRNA capping enzyme, catalytic domain-containing protein [Stachybotrys elegans]|uniref:mRNA-capping enzyme subunit alpha n=1 Tax=Stachybotrys elegans TaxID=80388 RepID=A0A8K0WYR8_9HYPO|nr:mRNA capping enzyme, catalytic domain-containing protein [Stachybotrys elegans]
MWNDEEDNNPYGTSFDRRDSQTSSSANPVSPDAREYRTFEAPHTPTSDSDDESLDHVPRHGLPHDDGDSRIHSDDQPPVTRRKPGGYDSRIEQILYENPDMPIMITDAGKSMESGGRYIVYTIRTGDLEVRRRYSEFASLRDALTRLHPTLIIPPIPEKHTMADYAANPTNAKQDQQIIDLRKRMLAVFLNRCRRMDAVRADGVWWRFLDPNASWSEVLHSHPVASIPKSVLKAPPLDTANPTAGHNYLPIPASSAKLKAAGGANHDISPSAIQSGTHVIGRFPPETSNLGEQELDPYFVSYEASIKEMEQLLTGPMEKVNRRTLSHLSSLAADLCELGSRFNAYALSEQAPSLGPAIERVGQAADHSYLATEELSGSLGASFAEPMRENAQFAGVVRGVLRYRVLKRVQQDLTAEELNKKRALLDQLEHSEAEARRIEQYLSSSQQLSPPPRRSASLREPPTHSRREGAQDDTESIDSDFPPTHGDFSAPAPSASQGLPERSASVSNHRKLPSGNSFTNKIFGPIRHAVQGVVDVDPERTRRDTIGKTKESIEQLEQAQVVSEKDVKEASASVLKDLKRFQNDKEEDLRRYMLAYAKSQIEWAKKSKQQWEEARAEYFLFLVTSLPAWGDATLSRQLRRAAQQHINATMERPDGTRAEGPIPSISAPGMKTDGQLLHMMRKEVAGLLGRHQTGFPGAQPVSFARQHLEELTRKDYYVCEKSDGIRYLLYSTADDNGIETHYLIDRKNDYWYITNRFLHFPLENDQSAFHTGTLIDGELVWDTMDDGTKIPKFLVFDCLLMDGNNLVDRTLDKRLAYFKDKLYTPYKRLFQDYPTERHSQPFHIEMKPFQLGYGIEMMFKQVLPNLRHGNDGLIFTCRNTPYKHGTDPHILKWKPPEENTIDCRLKLTFPTVEPDEEERKEGITAPFVDYDSVPKADILIYKGDSGPNKYEHFNKVFITEEEWEILKGLNDPLNDRIVECNLDDQRRWRIVRFRDDKNEANHKSTVVSVMESINDRVCDKDLLSVAGTIRDNWKSRAANEQPEKRSK